MAVLPVKALPVGYRFRPTDEELIDHYLRLKINRRDKEVTVIREIDVCKWEPWDLPGLSVVESTDNDWFFFCPKDRKYQNGQRLNRATEKGYWKATGKDRNITTRRGVKIGMKKTLVFYIGRAPDGKRTNWVIHEYRATDKSLDGTHPGQGAYILCRLFRKAELKQDDVTESSNINEVEEINASPPEVRSVDDEQSELVSPSLGGIAEPQPSSAGSHRNLSTQIAVAGTAIPIDWQSDSGIAYEIGDNVHDIKSIPPNPELEKLLDEFCYPVPQTTDGKMFSPLHSQMQSELGNPYFYNNINSDISDSQQTFPFQYGTNTSDDIEKFLNSVFVDSEEQCLPSIYNDDNYVNSLVKASNSCSESEGEVSQKQGDLFMLPVESFEDNIKQESPFQSEVSSEMLAVDQDAHSSYVSSGYDQGNLGYATNLFGLPNDSSTVASVNYIGHMSNVENTGLYSPAVEDTNSGTGIVRRKRQIPNQSTVQHTPAGTAPRRIRFQTKFQVGSVQCGLLKEPTNSKIKQEDDTAQDDNKAATVSPDESRASTCVDPNTDENSNDTSTNPTVKAESPYNKSEDIVSQRSGCALSVSSSRYMPKELMAMSLKAMLLAVWAFLYL
ncbi:hypothetical protein AAHA92_24245 [Salvia divinorum]|uniref:NAC domain-containing protein n=1 Tax=Salvia divinorum TaxID=28513 RepID=A0ABD1G9Y1_SALDI